jgi:hypothetical protein
MNVDDTTMVRHVDALLRDFVDDHRTLFGFQDQPSESALAEAGWRFFCDGLLRLRTDTLLPRLELVGDLLGRGTTKRENRRLCARHMMRQSDTNTT